jgi:hypothetical protein
VQRSSAAQQCSAAERCGGQGGGGHGGGGHGAARAAKEEPLESRQIAVTVTYAEGTHTRMHALAHNSVHPHPAPAGRPPPFRSMCLHNVSDGALTALSRLSAAAHLTALSRRSHGALTVRAPSGATPPRGRGGWGQPSCPASARAARGTSTTARPPGREPLESR